MSSSDKKRTSYEWLLSITTIHNDYVFLDKKKSYRLHSFLIESGSFWLKFFFPMNHWFFFASGSNDLFFRKKIGLRLKNKICTRRFSLHFKIKKRWPSKRISKQDWLNDWLSGLWLKNKVTGISTESVSRFI